MTILDETPFYGTTPDLKSTAGVWTGRDRITSRNTIMGVKSATTMDSNGIIGYVQYARMWGTQVHTRSA